MAHTHQGYNYLGLPSLSSFADAKAHYEKVRPIRGSDNVRPLGKNRRYRWVNIKQGMDCDSSGDPLGVWRPYYACSLGSYDLIKFYSNSDITIDSRCWRGWSIGSLLYFTLKDHIGVVKSHRGKWYFQNKSGVEYVFPEDGLLEMQLQGVVERTGEKIYVPKALVTEKRYVLKRKVMNDLRKKYKPFTDYAMTALSMNPTIDMQEVIKAQSNMKLDSFEFEHTIYRWGQKIDRVANRNKIAQALDKFISTNDLNIAYELMCLFSHKAGSYQYNMSVTTCEPKAFKNMFDEFLKYNFRDELFEVKEQPVGSPFKDDNMKYMVRAGEV